MKTKFKETELGIIPIDWEVNILNSNININKKSINKNFKFNIINYYDTSSITENRFLKPVLFNINEAPSRAKRLVEINDIVISTVRPNQKHFGFINKKKENDIYSTGFAVISTNVNLNSKYLYYYLTSEIFTNYLSQIAESHTSTYPSFKPEIIKNSLIPLPPLQEQKTIAKILSDLDEKIEINRKINKNLEELGQALFKRWFIDFEFPNENEKPYKSSGGDMVESELGLIPNGWKVGKYLDLVEITTGKGKNKKEYVENGQYSIIGANGEIGRSNNFLYNEKIVVTGRVGTLGEVNFINKKVWISDNVLISIPKIKENIYFIYFLLKSFDLLNLNSGSTQPLITQTSLKNYITYIPNQKVLYEFNKRMLSLFNKKEQIEKEIQSLQQIRDSLLPKLMSGQIRVK